MIGVTALDNLLKETRQRPIITLCRRLDDAIGNGIAPGILTEFCGTPGSGKTQMCLQLCVNVQIPRSIGGTGGKAIFIDTCQDFNPYRLQEIANSCANRYKDVFKNSSGPSTEVDFSAENILSRVTYYYCNDHQELIAVVEALKNILKSDKDINLITIDSICHPFRILSDDYAERTRILMQLLTDLQIMADENELSVVMTNDFTTRFDENGEHYLCPALGDSHGHKIGQRILLSRKSKTDDEFVAYLDKTMFAPPEYISFKITEGGIRGAD